MAAPQYDQYTTSTNYDPKYTMESLFPAYALTYEDGTVQIKRDYLGQMARRIKRITRYTPYQYQGYETLTTIVYKAYGNTTLVYAVMMYNSISHRLELIPNQIIKLPDFSSLLNPSAVQPSSQGNNVSNVGKKVLI